LIDCGGRDRLSERALRELIPVFNLAVDEGVCVQDLLLLLLLEVVGLLLSLARSAWAARVTRLTLNWL